MFFLMPDPRRVRLTGFAPILGISMLLACGGSGSADESSEASTDSEASSEGETDASEASSASSESEEATETDTTEETGTQAELELTISDNPDMTIAPFADIVGADDSATRITVYEDGVEVLNREVSDIDPSDPESLRTFLWGLRADTDYTIIADADLPGGLGVSPEVAFSTGSLPVGVPTLTVSNHDETRAHEGLVMFSVRADGYQIYLGVNPAGEIVWYHETGGTGNKLNGDLKVMADGRLMLFRPGGVQVIEPWGEVVFGSDYTFHHDVTPLPNGNYLLLGRVNEDIDVAQLGGVVTVKVDTLTEVTPEGTEVTNWVASDHLDTQYYPSALSMGGDPVDWTHDNAAYYDADNSRVLLSARHLHWVVAIDWPSGDVQWRMGPGGDFAFSGAAEDWFYAQHAPEPDGDGRMVVYDNGNERPGGQNYSRGVVIDYDETAMTAEVSWDHVITPQTSFLGDADRMSNGNVLMTAGGALASTDPVRIIEAAGDASSDVVWELSIDGGGNVYRATNLETLEGL